MAKSSAKASAINLSGIFPNFRINFKALELTFSAVHTIPLVNLIRVIIYRYSLLQGCKMPSIFTYLIAVATFEKKNNSSNTASSGFIMLIKLSSFFICRSLLIIVILYSIDYSITMVLNCSVSHVQSNFSVSRINSNITFLSSPDFSMSNNSEDSIDKFSHPFQY